MTRGYAAPAMNAQAISSPGMTHRASPDKIAAFHCVAKCGHTAKHAAKTTV